ncbi:MAG: PQQ-binding-like beta-propeller repeat protein [Planctomycetes bacterium]|nr:PQQ-binding-like beta-propeller repeat protein [Planctomycetota bacterium]
MTATPLRMAWLAFLMVLVGEFVAPVRAQDDAAQGRAAPARSEAPSVAWTYEGEGASFDGVFVDHGVAYAIDRKGRVHAIETTTGKAIWVARDIPMSYGFGIARSPNTDPDYVFVGCDSGLVGLHRESGKVAWHTKIDLGVAGPACTNDSVVAASADGNVYACNLKTGAILWKQDYLDDAPGDPPGFHGDNARFDGKPARPAGASTDGRIVAISIFDQCRTIAFDAKTGERLWSFPTKGWQYGEVRFDPRNAYFGSQDKHFYAVDKKRGKLVWKVESKARVEAPGAPTKRTTYFGSCDGKLYAVDRVMGSIQWTCDAAGKGSPIYAAPAVVGDTVYFATLRPGKLYAVDRECGELRWKLEPLADSEINSDVVTDGTLLLVTTRRASEDKGKSAVVAIRTSR